MRSWVPILILLSIAPGVFGGPPGWRFDLDRRQDPTSVPGPFATTDPATTDPSLTTPSTTPDVTDTTAPDTTTPVLTTETTPLTTSEPTTSTPTPTSAVTTQSSVPLLFTQSTTTSSRSVLANTATPTAVSDTNVPFSQSKYHQLIIALGCLSVALIIALVGTAIIAFRARADVDLLRDRLSRFEEGFDLPQRKRDSSHSMGYGRVSMSDPDDSRNTRSRRSMSDAWIDPRPGPKTDHRQSTGGRRVTFGSGDDAPLLPSHERERRGSAPPRPLMLPKKSDDSVHKAPPMSSSPTQVHAPRAPISPPRPMGHTSGPRPNPAPRRISLQDPGPAPLYSPPHSQVRRLPAAPSSRESSTLTYVDPYGEGYPTK